MLFLVGLGSFLGSVAFALRALFPREYLTLGMGYLERLPTWSEIRKPPTDVRGAAMRGLVRAIARERRGNDGKADAIRRSLVLLGVGLSLIAVEAGTLALEVVFG